VQNKEKENKRKNKQKIVRKCWCSIDSRASVKITSSFERQLNQIHDLVYHQYLSATLTKCYTKKKKEIWLPKCKLKSTGDIVRIKTKVK
jgi:uncharacterized protein CbrC (UPF0167 family)